SAVTLLWLAHRYPMTGTGAWLAFMPVFTLVFLVAKFFGPSYMQHLDGIDRVPLLLFVLILWHKNGIKLIAPDWFLIAAFFLAALHLLAGGQLIGVLSDFDFMIAYAAGRLAVLNTERELTWANRAVWIVAVLAVLGMVEIFVIGPGPRTILYLAVSPIGTYNGALNNSFHAQGYDFLRESSTMYGPLWFGPLCMAALVIWWVYSRKFIPG